MRPASLLAPLALLAGLFFALGCERSPSRRLTWREGRELLAITDEGLFITAHAGWGNTGLLRGQGSLHVDLLPGAETTLGMHRDLAPSAIRWNAARDRVALGANALELEPLSWTLSVREGTEYLDATIRLTAEVLPLEAEGGPPASVPPTVLVEGERQWTVGSPLPLATLTGAWRSGERGGLLQGAGMVVRRAGDLLPGTAGLGHAEGGDGRLSAYVFDRAWSVGVERRGTQALTWMADADGVQRGRTLTVEGNPHRLRLDLRPDLPVRILLKGSGRSTRYDPWAHLLWFERLLVDRVWRAPVRNTQVGVAQVRSDSKLRQARGAWIWHEGVLPVTGSAP